MNISPNDFIHPEDAAALDNLRSIPLFTTCLKAFMNVISEEFLFGTNMAQKIRLGPDQLPDIHRHLPPVCDRLGIDLPELYLEMNPFPNAYTYGDSRVFITVTSGLVEALNEKELQAVIAHECGHIVCRHVIYHTMADLLLRYGSVLVEPLAVATAPVQFALRHWDRRSELSADRAAALVLGGPDSVIGTMIRLAGGPSSITGKVNLDLYIQQANAYDKLHESTWDKLLQSAAAMQQTHPFLAVRTKEIRDWCATDRFALLVESLKSMAAGDRCRACGQPHQPGWKFCTGCGAAVRAEEVLKEAVCQQN